MTVSVLASKSHLSLDGKDFCIPQGAIAEALGLPESTLRTEIKGKYTPVRELAKYFNREEKPRKNSNYYNSKAFVMMVQDQAMKGNRRALYIACLMSEKGAVNYIGLLQGVDTKSIQIMRESHKATYKALSTLPTDVGYVVNQIHIGLFGQDCSTFCQERGQSHGYTPDCATPSELEQINWSRQRFIHNFNIYSAFKGIDYIIELTVEETLQR